MNNIIILWMLALIMPLSAFSQSQPRSEVIRTDEKEFLLNDKASFNFQYLLDEFIPGTIFLKNKKPVKTSINYNILMDAIQYYDEDNTLLTIAKDLPVDSVVMGNHLLIPFQEEGFIEMFHTGKGALYLKHTITYHTEVLKKGPYGSIERTSAVDKVNTLHREGLWGKDVVIHNTPRDDMEIRMRYKQTYFFPADDGILTELSSRKNTTRAFPEHSSEINRFIRKNKIDFDAPQSMIQLAAFLHDL